jgi:urease accessory protein
MSTNVAPELSAYQDEPPQLRSGFQGKNALLRLRFETRTDPNRSILAFSERRAPLIVQRALYCDEGMPALPVVFIISNSGGILQGDRYAMEFSVGPDACGHITTQAATKIHEMDANHAAQTQEITVEDGAYLEYLPDHVIPFRRSRFHTRTRIRIAPTATLLYAETLMGGRQFYGDGELFEFDLYSAAVTAERLSGEQLFAEKFLIEPHRSPASRRGVMGEFSVFANVLLFTPKEHADAIFSRVKAIWNQEEQLAAGASRLPNDAGLAYRVLGMDTEKVRAKVREFWSLVRPEVTGFEVPPQFPWQ